MRLKFFAAIVPVLFSVAPARAGIISITGSLVSADEVYTTMFTLATVADINIQTWGMLAVQTRVAL